METERDTGRSNFRVTLQLAGKHISLYVRVSSCSIALTPAFHAPEIPFPQSLCSMQTLSLFGGSSDEMQPGVWFRGVSRAELCQH